MDWAPLVAALSTGFALGLAAAFALRLVHAKTARQLADDLFREAESQRKAGLEAVIENVKASFGSLSLEALSKSTDEFLKLAKARLETETHLGARELDSKKELIDERLQTMAVELEKVSLLVKELEKDRVEKFGELSVQLKAATEQTGALAQLTYSLKEALASSKTRGRWGERMAEDVLRLAGFTENVNYLKQKTIEGNGARPDFTFLLPRGLKLNMDVKFPLDNYVRYLEAGSEEERARFRSDFLRDVKNRMKEVATRNYIDPEQNTLDYAILFIPNEQVYGFIHEQDNTIMDNAIGKRLVLCSPITLFAVLGVIRHVIDNFALEKTSNEILSLLGAFNKQWHEFVRKLDMLGRRIGEAQSAYDDLQTTRRRQLERPLVRIEQLRTERGLLAEEPDEVELIAAGAE